MTAQVLRFVLFCSALPLVASACMTREPTSDTGVRTPGVTATRASTLPAATAQAGTTSLFPTPTPLSSPQLVVPAPATYATLVRNFEEAVRNHDPALLAALLRTYSVEGLSGWVHRPWGVQSDNPGLVIPNSQPNLAALLAGPDLRPVAVVAKKVCSGGCPQVSGLLIENWGIRTLAAAGEAPGRGSRVLSAQPIGSQSGTFVLVFEIEGSPYNDGQMFIGGDYPTGYVKVADLPR